jgi:hypothetical protein
MKLVHTLRLQMESNFLQIPLGCVADEMVWSPYPRTQLASKKDGSEKYWVFTPSSIVVKPINEADEHWRLHSVCCVAALGCDVGEQNQFLLVFFPNIAGAVTETNANNFGEYCLVPNKGSFLSEFGRNKKLNNIWGETESFVLEDEDQGSLCVTLFPLKDAVLAKHPNSVVRGDAIMCWNQDSASNQSDGNVSYRTNFSEGKVCGSNSMRTSF